MGSGLVRLAMNRFKARGTLSGFCHGAGAQVDLAPGQLRDDLTHRLGLDKERPPDINQDVVTVVAARGHQAAQIGRGIDLLSSWIPPDGFASDPGSDGQSNHLASAGFEDLPGASGWLGQDRRVGEVNEPGLGKQSGTAGLLSELLPAVTQRQSSQAEVAFFLASDRGGQAGR
jgi:hypothetical protein